MRYDFRSLTAPDFEDLVLDLIGKELGFRFEAFIAPDQGVDGRHANAKGKSGTILQAKHYVGSKFSDLSKTMKEERNAVDKLKPSRYILATSQNLTKANKDTLKTTLGKWLKKTADIYTAKDLNQLLEDFPLVEKAHFKLWLSSSTVLQTIVHAASHAFNNITLGEIEAKLKVFAPNPSLEEAAMTLNENHIVIVSGPPGVGKSTLAEMLAYSHLAEGWTLQAIRNLDEGFAAINDREKQVFLFDDFLGRIALDRRALAHTDSDLARFLKRVRSSPNARFILTTRAYIFEEARTVSEHLADRRLDVTKYVLDVGKYTRRIRARILYNHLVVASTPHGHIAALINAGAIGKIVDHPHYNPRIIEMMTEGAHLRNVRAEEYPSRFLDTLDHPTHIWDTAFRTHISKPCHHLLFAMFFASDYGINVEDVRPTYDSIHPLLSAKYGDAHGPKDFEESVRVLEGGFVTIEGYRLNYVNPSLRDYLNEYLKDISLLLEFARAAVDTDWAHSLWSKGRPVAEAEDRLAEFANAFIDIARAFYTITTYRKREENGAVYQSHHGLSYVRRVEMLLELWEASGNKEYQELAFALADGVPEGFDSWMDGADVVDLAGRVKDGGYFTDLENPAALTAALERGAIDMIERGIRADELENLATQVDRWQRLLDPSVGIAVDEAIRAEILQVEDAMSYERSISTLESYEKTVQRLAKRASLDADEVENALRAIKRRKESIADETDDAESPTVQARSAARDIFSDKDMRNLFAPLLEKR